jgi:hypothetical protein
MPGDDRGAKQQHRARLVRHRDGNGHGLQECYHAQQELELNRRGERDRVRRCSRATQPSGHQESEDGDRDRQPAVDELHSDGVVHEVRPYR